MHRITLIPGDGIGPEITEAMCEVVEATGIKIKWDFQEAGASVMEEHGTPLPSEVIESIKKNKIAIKGPITTPIGTGFRSINVALRKALDLYVNLRPTRSLEGIKSPFNKIDLVVVRENTEDLYAGIEHMVGDDAAESIKIITRGASERIIRFAFEYALEEDRKKVTAVTKANIMKYTDGLFLDCGRKISQEYPQIEYEERLVDNMAMQLVQKPQQYDVMVMPNLYGDIISDLCAGLAGGLGLAAGANIGKEYAVFEPAHGSAPKYAGKNKVNPTAIILSGVLMLKHLGEQEAAKEIFEATAHVIKEGKKVTYDLGGSASTLEMAKAIAQRIK